MPNIVTMRLKDYDKLKLDIECYRSQIKDLKEERIRELKEIFILDEGYDSFGLNIQATDIIKEIYGDELEIYGNKYINNKDKITVRIGYVWEEEESE